MRDEFLEPGVTGETEDLVEVGLRPRLLADFVGQRELKEHLPDRKHLLESNRVSKKLEEQVGAFRQELEETRRQVTALPEETGSTDAHPNGSRECQE